MLKDTHITYHLILAATAFTKFQHVLTYIGNDRVGVNDKLSLRVEWLATTNQERVEHTLKTWRILLRSDFQAAMASLSSLE